MSRLTKSCKTSPTCTVLRSVIPNGRALSVLPVGLAISTASSLISLSLPSQSLDEYLESARIAEINGWAPGEVPMERREAELAGEDFEDGVAAAVAAKPESWAAAIRAGRNPPNAPFPCARPVFKHTAKTTVEGAVEHAVEAIVKMTEEKPKDNAVPREEEDVRAAESG